MKKKMRASMQTLEGVVTPYAWDQSDRVSSVSLSATDDEEYIIENGGGFIELVQQPIRATGLVTIGKKVQRSINIKRFDVLDSQTVDG